MNDFILYICDSISTLKIDDFSKAIIAVLGFGFPLMFNLISKLDDRYASTHIVELFNKEPIRKWFYVLLIMSLISVGISAFNFKPLIQFDKPLVTFIIDNSANIIVAICAFCLICSFFLLVKKIEIYYVPKYLVKYLQNKHSQNRENNKSFVALGDIFINAIKKDIFDISKDISDFFYLEFQIFRNESKNETLNYPSDYYDIAYKSTVELSMLKNKRNSDLEYYITGGLWFWGEFSYNKIKISEETYRKIWLNLRVAVKYERDDMIIQYWGNAHQYWDYHSDKFDEKEKEDFLELHYALGALLVYKKRYECVKNLFDHITNSTLLPLSMSDIFDKYLKIIEMKYPQIVKYSFLETNGVTAKAIIKNVLYEYLAILFLRQYLLPYNLILSNPLASPGIPPSQNEIEILLREIDDFKEYVSKCIKNVKLMQELKLDFITEDWCKSNKKPFPINFIEKYKSNLQNAILKQKVCASIEEEKRENFEQSIVQITKAIEPFVFLKNNSTHTSDIKFSILGERTLYDKQAFTEYSDTYYDGYATDLAISIADKLTKTLLNCFPGNITKKYLFEIEKIPQAIRKLKIDKNYVVISFGIEKSKLEIHTEIECFYLPYNLQGNLAILIMKKSDLPNLVFQDLPENEINRYSLVKKDDTYKIYTSIIEMKDARSEIKKLYNYEETEKLDLKVLLNISLFYKINLKRNVKYIEIIQHSKFIQNGIIDSLDDISTL